MLFMAVARNCAPLMFRYVLMFNTFVSACRCVTGVDFVQPVMILSALFCFICSFWSCVLQRSRGQTGLASDSTDLMYRLFISVSVYLSLPKCVPLSARMAFSLLFPSSICYVTDVLYVTPSIFGSRVCGTGVLLSVMFGKYLLVWCVSLVSSGQVDLAGATWSLFLVSHCEIV